MNEDIDTKTFLVNQESVQIQANNLVKKTNINYHLTAS